MSQLMQENLKNLEDKPSWMEMDVWEELMQYWNSSKFKKKSQTNKRNRNSMVGASLHTGGSIPHCLHWNRMKKEKGVDPSLTEFYFRTHRKKKDQSWVGVHAESAYEKFEHKKMELSTQKSTFGSGEDEVDSQPTCDMPTDLDIWVDSVGIKKGRIFGLGSISKTLIPSSNQQANRPNSKEVDFLRSQVHALNASLQRQEQEKLEMRQQMQRQEKEMINTNKKLSAIMKHLGFVGSSSHDVPNSTDESNELMDEDDNNEFVEDVNEDYMISSFYLESKI